MTLSNNAKSKTFHSKTLGLALAAVLVPAGLSMASDGHRHRSAHNVSGHVEVVKQIPGGVVTVGAEWGRPRPVIVQQPQVVVVEQRPQVVVVERERPRKVVVVREEKRCEPVREVTVIKTRERGHGRGHGYGRGHGRGHGHDKKVVVVEKNRGRGHGEGNYHYYRDAEKVSESRSDRSGNYHYYEDAHQISIDDNRHGRREHTYVRK